MAFLDEEEAKKKQGLDQPSAAPGDPMAQAPSGGGLLGGTSAGQGPVSSAGVGAGGMGGWTNIQAYLNANNTYQGSANLLKDKAGGQLTKEKSTLDKQVADNKGQVDKYVNESKMGTDQASQIIKDSASNYNWDGEQADPYKQGVQKVQGYLGSQYQGPNSFAYGISADTQKNRDAITGDDAFQEYMNQIYREKSGVPMTSGQSALQNQFDVQNEPLAQTRQNLLQEYAGLNDYVNQAVTNTDAYIGKGRDQYGQNISALKDYLNNQVNQLGSGIDNSIQGARDSYTPDYAAAKQAADNTYNERVKGDVFGDNYGDTSDPHFTSRQRERRQQIIDSAAAERDQALENFYAQQEAKYGGTAVPEKQEWNTLMDILRGESKRERGNDVVRRG